MSLDSIFTGFGNMVGTAVKDKKNRKLADKQRGQGIDLINSLDYEPEYASNLVPQYQKTQSPVARSYLESFLMGNNPISTRSAATNSAATKGRQQTAQNAMFGTPEERIAKQRQIESTNPYLVKTPARPVVGAQDEEVVHGVKNPGATRQGLTSAQYNDLVAKGVIDPNDMGEKAIMGGMTNTNALANAYAAGDFGAIKTILHPEDYKRKHSVMRNKHKRERARKIDSLIDKYDGED